MPAQYRVIWSTLGGGTGYSVFHFTEAGTSPAAQQIADDVGEFFEDLQVGTPNDVSWSFDSEVLDLSDAGVLTAVWPVTPPAPLAGVGTGIYARAQGIRIDWSTDAIVAGRRLSGRTFIVPQVAATFDANGLIEPTSQGGLETAADNFLAATALNRPLRVWSRTHATSSVVTGRSVPPQGAILRGRRD